LAAGDSKFFNFSPFLPEKWGYGTPQSKKWGTGTPHTPINYAYDDAAADDDDDYNNNNNNNNKFIRRRNIARL